MKKTSLAVGAVLLLSALCASAGMAPVAAQPDTAAKVRVSQSYGRLPLSFEANAGQTDPQVKFLARGPGYTVYLTPTEAVLALRQVQAPADTSASRRGVGANSFARVRINPHLPYVPAETRPSFPAGAPADGLSSLLLGEPPLFSSPPALDLAAIPSLPGLIQWAGEGRGEGANPSIAPKTAAVRLKLVGANPAAQMEGVEPLPGKVNYFIGNDPKKWRTDVPTYAKVRYKEVHPGIDLVYYGNPRQLEHDFIVMPGADPRAIRLAFEGVDGRLKPALQVDADGDLVLHADGGDVHLRKPVIYQRDGSKRKEIEGAYVLVGAEGGILAVKLQVAAYDASKPLVIDPVLIYSTYLGGSYGDYGGGIAVDAAGNSYVSGVANSADFPTRNALQGSMRGPHDAFVAKLDVGGSLVYSTYLGGSASDGANGIAADGAGNAYVTGATCSADFPTRNALQGSFQGWCNDAFIAKLDAGGSLVYSTYLGGNSDDVGLGIAVDSVSNAYVTGHTFSADFPTRNALQGSLRGPNYNAFVAKLDAGGSLVYSTYLGGGADEGRGIAVDGAGDAYVTGWTYSADFPTRNAPYPNFGGIADVFVAKLNAAGTALVYSTYLGGSDADAGVGIAVDGASNAYVTGIHKLIRLPHPQCFSGQS